MSISFFQECDPSKLLVTHIVGALFHGRVTYSVINLTISCLLKSLPLDALANLRKLRPVLYIQLDNRIRGNKNKFFLGIPGPLWFARGLVKEVA